MTEVELLTEFVKKARDGGEIDSMPVSEKSELGELSQAIKELVIEHSQAFNMWKQHMVELTEITQQASRLQKAVLLVNEIESIFHEGGKAKTYYQKVIEIIAEALNVKYGMIALIGDNGGFNEISSVGMKKQVIDEIGHLPQGKGLLGVLCGADKVTRIDNVVDHSAACGFPEGHPKMTSLLSVPIKVQGKIIGAIYVSEKLNEGRFNATDENNFQNIADHIAHAFDRNELISVITKANRNLQIEQDEQKVLIKKVQEAQNQLLQSEKLASIGQLAAGVAHEINNPVGYINSNVSSLENYMVAIFSLLDAYELSESMTLNDVERLKISALRKQIDISFLREDVGDLIKETKEGVVRVKRIVQDLKDFSHVDNAKWQWVNIHDGLNSTLNVVQNEIKYKANVIKEYGELPEVECLPSQLNQVFMNLFVNAAHAIENSGTITIRTGTQEDDWVWIEVSDTGKGIKQEHLTKLFDPFFTTKPVGKGTGLGLSLSFGIIEKHGGRIDVDSELDKGTRFTIRIPVKQASREQSIGSEADNIMTGT